jgi:glutamate-1-semialdehyde 2,1-aminomutase
VAVDTDRRAAGLADRAHAITERELVRYAERTTGSQRATDRARRVMPLGVPSSFQAYDPHPIVVRHAAGARMVDVDGHEYVDYDMGFGALFAGHMHPAVRSAIAAQLDEGTLYVTPCELNADVAELLAERYQLPMWRFTNSGTEANELAMLMARLYTGNTDIIAVRNGYHGGSQAAMGLTSMFTWKFPVAGAGAVHHALNPDRYRTPFDGTNEEIARRSAAEIGRALLQALNR